MTLFMNYITEEHNTIVEMLCPVSTGFPSGNEEKISKIPPYI